jgi:hypothetical protein
VLHVREEGAGMTSTRRELILGAACSALVLVSIASCSKSKGDDSPPVPSPNPKAYEALAELPTLRVGDSTTFANDAHFTVKGIKYLTKIQIKDEESVDPTRGFFVRIDVLLEAHHALNLRWTTYDWTSPQGDELKSINPEAAIAWEYNPLGRQYVGSGSAEGAILMDVPKKGGKVTVHLNPTFVIQLPSK